MQARAAYDELLRRAREEALLASCASLLGWDELTYMPRGGVANRGNQMAYLAGLEHDLSTHPRIGELLDELERSPLMSDPHAPPAVNVREIRRVYDRATRVPRQLVEDLARTTSAAQQAWVAARQDNDFAYFRPWLKKIVALKRREAEAVGYQAEPYDALLDEYEPGATTRELTRLFASLRRDLVPLAAAIGEARRKPNVALLHRDYAIERQRIFGEAVAGALGFDFENGRLDPTAHPFFSTIGPGDCRITTRYHATHFNEAFFGLLHELGHGLYEQGLDPEHYGTPLGDAVSLGMHEAQARLWENLVGRSRPFWEHFFPRARQVFHETLADVTLDDFYRAINHVGPSCNRVQADEVTYNLHVLVRFELEQALLSGDLKPADVPAAWNEAYRHYLGVTPANDAEGCLQDGHWSSGLIGYFPTYTLGNVFAAQLFARAAQDLDGLDGQFARGDFGSLLRWLRTHVYRQGRRYSAAVLIERVTGAAPDHRPLIEALQQKYSALYEI
jgi:carboxypeptidase Taq